MNSTTRRLGALLLSREAKSSFGPFSIARRTIHGPEAQVEHTPTREEESSGPTSPLSYDASEPLRLKTRKLQIEGYKGSAKNLTARFQAYVDAGHVAQFNIRESSVEAIYAPNESNTPSGEASPTWNGTIEFHSEDVAEEAFANLNGGELDGLPLRLTPLMPPKAPRERVKRADPLLQDPQTLHFRGFDGSSESLKKAFEKYTESLDVRQIVFYAPQNREPEEGNRNGLILFTSNRAAREALEELNNTDIEGAKLMLSYFRRKADVGPPPHHANIMNKTGRKLDIGSPPRTLQQTHANLPDKTKLESDLGSPPRTLQQSHASPLDKTKLDFRGFFGSQDLLKRWFTRYVDGGHIESFIFNKDPGTGKITGTGSIQFKSETVAADALSTLDRRRAQHSYLRLKYHHTLENVKTPPQKETLTETTLEEILAETTPEQETLTQTTPQKETSAKTSVDVQHLGLEKCQLNFSGYYGHAVPLIKELTRSYFGRHVKSFKILRNKDTMNGSLIFSSEEAATEAFEILNRRVSVMGVPVRLEKFKDVEDPDTRHSENDLDKRILYFRGYFGNGGILKRALKEYHGVTSIRSHVTRENRVVQFPSAADAVKAFSEMHRSLLGGCILEFYNVHPSILRAAKQQGPSKALPLPLPVILMDRSRTRLPPPRIMPTLPRLQTPHHDVTPLK